MNNVNYVKLTVEAKDVTLIIDEFTPYFKAYKLSGHTNSIDNSIKISGYITGHNFHRLKEEAQHFATVNIYVEEIITC